MGMRRENWKGKSERKLTDCGKEKLVMLKRERQTQEEKKPTQGKQVISKETVAGCHCERC